MQTRMVKPNPGGFYQNVLLADRLEHYDFADDERGQTPLPSDESPR
jgi:hypothetical protein